MIDETERDTYHSAVDTVCITMSAFGDSPPLGIFVNLWLAEFGDAAEAEAEGSGISCNYTASGFALTCDDAGV